MTDQRVPSFDQSQRYAVLAALHEACVRASDAPELGVLDVGGFFRDFDGRPVLPARELTAADHAIVVDREAWNHAESTSAFAATGGYCRADAGQLPFTDGAFALVACVDVLEHVPRASRADVIREISRVCSGWLLIAVPFADDGAPTREQLFAEFIAATGQHEHEQLGEHIRFGLPTHAEMLDMLPASTRTFAYGNLDRWLVMMLAKHYLLALPYNMPTFHRLDRAYAKHDPSGDRRPPFFRRFYLVRVGTDVSDAPLDHVASEFQEIGPTGGDRASLGDEMLSWLLKELAEADADRLDDARAPAVEENAVLRRDLAEHRRALETEHAALEEIRELLRAVEASWTYRLSKLMRRIVPFGRRR